MPDCFATVIDRLEPWIEIKRIVGILPSTAFSSRSQDVWRGTYALIAYPALQDAKSLNILRPACVCEVRAR